MALTNTTNSAAIAAGDLTITVASATDFAANKLVKVGQEFMLIRKDYVSGTAIPVHRAQMGTANVAHGITSNVQVGTGEDFASSAAQGPNAYPFTRVRQMKSYGASGAITLPTPGNDMVAILNGTSVLSMTIADPTKDQDGDMLIVLGNGIAAHILTYTAGFGRPTTPTSYDVTTFDAAGQGSVMLIACNGTWVFLPSPISGTLTNVDMALT
jgi:hypothetical protein